MSNQVLNIGFNDLKYVFKRIDGNNNMDFSTLKIAMYKDIGNIDDYMFYEVTSFLENELGIYCDAELVDITNEELEKLVEFINEMELE